MDVKRVCKRDKEEGAHDKKGVGGGLVPWTKEGRFIVDHCNSEINALTFSSYSLTLQYAAACLLCSFLTIKFFCPILIPHLTFLPPLLIRYCLLCLFEANNG